ncbi:MAG TPA: class I SAM-dependent methyltransferase [Solirubrobacterales bacterium]|nr:class I SAM-dependent methyltransferase [Solirubrobacterales bacterium]
MTKVWEQVFSAVYDPLLWIAERAGMATRREDLLSRADGRVLELGAGTGLNLDHYPEDIEQLVLTEPAAPMVSKLERRAKRSGNDSRIVLAPAEQLPFEDDSFDTVVSTLVLCTVDDPRRAIREVARVLRPGGQLLFLEHVRSDSARLARWQDRLHRPWHAFAAGCNANRATVELLRESDLHVQTVDRARWSWMPALVHPLAIGRAQAS